MCVDKHNFKCLGALQTSGFCPLGRLCPPLCIHAAEVAGTLAMAWVIGVGGYLSAEGGFSGPQPFESESSTLATSTAPPCITFFWLTILIYVICMFSMFTNFQNIIQSVCHYQITIVAYNPHVINNNFKSYFTNI